MSDPLRPDLAGKGKRVAGVFVVMIAASVILDTHALWIGAPVLGAGVALFAWGLAEARASEPLAAPVRDAPTESPP